MLFDVVEDEALTTVVVDAERDIIVVVVVEGDVIVDIPIPVVAFDEDVAGALTAVVIVVAGARRSTLVSIGDDATTADAGTKKYDMFDVG